MNSDVLQTIASILPIVILTLVIERRAIHKRIRRVRWIQRVLFIGTAMGLVGIAYSVVGLALSGLAGGAAMILWTLCIAAFVAFSIAVTAMIATSEIEEDEKKPS